MIHSRANNLDRFRIQIADSIFANEHIWWKILRAHKIDKKRHNFATNRVVIFYTILIGLIIKRRSLSVISFVCACVYVCVFVNIQWYREESWNTKQMTHNLTSFPSFFELSWPQQRMIFFVAIAKWCVWAGLTHRHSQINRIYIWPSPYHQQIKDAWAIPLYSTHFQTMQTENNFFPPISSISLCLCIIYSQSLKPKCE